MKRNQVFINDCVIFQRNCFKISDSILFKKIPLVYDSMNDVIRKHSIFLNMHYNTTRAKQMQWFWLQSVGIRTERSGFVVCLGKNCHVRERHLVHVKSLMAENSFMFLSKLFIWECQARWTTPFISSRFYITGSNSGNDGCPLWTHAKCPSI